MNRSHEFGVAASCFEVVWSDLLCVESLIPTYINERRIVALEGDTLFDARSQESRADAGHDVFPMIGQSHYLADFDNRFSERQDVVAYHAICGGMPYVERFVSAIWRDEGEISPVHQI